MAGGKLLSSSSKLRRRINSWGTKAGQVKSKIHAQYGLLKREIHTLYLACRDPRVPWYTKAIVAIILGYVLSPIDIIPDFIPVLGQLDDIAVVRAGLFFLRKMIPKEVYEKCKEKAEVQPISGKREKWIVGSIIALMWLLTVYMLLKLLWKRVVKGKISSNLK